LSSVRSGDLAPYEERAPIQRVEDATAISPGRAIPPAEITAIISRYKHVDPIEAMIPVLQEMQVQFGYITQDAAEQMSRELGISPTEVYGVMTFYSFFRYTPRAGHVIMSCEGTGCYVRGAARVREAIENSLNVGPGDTSEDGVFTFEPQSICLGACDLGPLVEIEGTYYSHVTPEKMDAILTQWREAGDDKPVGDNLTGGHVPNYEENYGFGPPANELYEDYDVARFMRPTGTTGPITSAQVSPALDRQMQSSPPTPQPGGQGASGSESQS
jgi:NADH:ubiquinone oxidoreductase subunit E